MKYLSDYTKKGYSDLFKKTGAFFAFGQEQFDEAKKDGVVYVALGAGLYVPKENVVEFNLGYDEVHKNGISQDLSENGVDAIILRELNNYECFYVCSVDDALPALAEYGITREQVEKVYREKR